MFVNQCSSTSGSNLENVRILNRVRLVALSGQLVLTLFSAWYLDINLPLIWLLSIIGLELIFQLYCYRLVAQKKLISSTEIFYHIVLDSLILAGLVYLSGGANNPFIYLLLLFVAISSFILPARYLLMITALQLVLYSLLNIYQTPLDLASDSPITSFHLHMKGMWVNFILTAMLIAIFGCLTRNSMLKKEKKLQSLREKHLQDEQILGLGIMSASAAHELGTPLSTMAIIIDDLQHVKLSSDLQDDMQLLVEQISKCKNIIGALSEKSRHAQQLITEQDVKDYPESSVSFKQRLESIIENWLVYRPQVKLQKFWEKGFHSVEKDISISMAQAITNLLDNAADASIANTHDLVEFSCSVKNNNIVIEINDYGRGISPEKKHSLGTRIQKTKKQDGLGWGLFLSNVSIERVSGSVQLLENEYGGTLTRILLPAGT